MILNDGGELFLDWLDQNQSGPLLVVLPGFENGSRATYIRYFVRYIKNNSKIGIVVINFRGYDGAVLKVKFLI